MSWDSYIGNIIARSKDEFGNWYTDKACIIGLDGSIWTTAGHANAIRLTTIEAATIAKCFKAKEFSQFISCGIVAEGRKYIFIKEIDETTVFARLKNYGAVTLQCSKTGIVIAHTEEEFRPHITMKAVYATVKYLEALNM